MPNLHRIHIRLPQEDIQWLKTQAGEHQLIAATVRQLIKNLREKHADLNHTNTEDILDERLDNLLDTAIEWQKAKSLKAKNPSVPKAYANLILAETSLLDAIKACQKAESSPESEAA